MVSDRDGIAPLEPGLHHAALIIRTALAAVLVAQVDLDPSDVIARMGQGALNDTCNPCFQRFVMLDIVIGINLNLQSLPLIAFVRFLSQPYGR